MNRLGHFFSTTQRMRWGKVFDNSHLSKEEQQYLQQVYMIMGLGALATVAGFYMYTLGWAAPWWIALGLQLIATLVLGSSRYTNKREVCASAFGVFAFMVGQLLAPWCISLMVNHPNVVPTAVTGTIVIFTCFSVASTYLNNRMQMLLASALSSLFLYAGFAAFINIFVGSYHVFRFLNVLTLIGYIGLVVYDTQMTIERHRQGCRDVWISATGLYLDFIGIMIRLADILADREKRQERDSRSR